MDSIESLFCFLLHKIIAMMKIALMCIIIIFARLHCIGTVFIVNVLFSFDGSPLSQNNNDNSFYVTGIGGQGGLEHSSRSVY